MENSKVLRGIIGCILASAIYSHTPNAAAWGYCSDSGCKVFPDVPISGGGGGSGGGWHGSGSDWTSGEDADQYQATACVGWRQDIEAENCSVLYPPPLIVNGCGSANFDVPDFLISPVSPAAALAFGAIFTSACNRHDICYGTVPKNANQYARKEDCDNALYNDMVAAASATIPATLKPIFMPAVYAQANAYSKGLQYEGIAPFTSIPVFEQAQQEGWCRNVAASWNEHC